MTKSLETKRSFLSVSRIVLAVLMCLLFTGCALLDVKDKGGMENPDVVSRAETTSTTGNTAEDPMSRFIKKETGTEIRADRDELPRETSGTKTQKPISEESWMTKKEKLP